MSPRSILLAEDSPQDAEMTINALESSGMTNSIVHVHDGAEVLDYLYGRGRFADQVPTVPVVVLLDLKMPKVDGLEVLRVLKSDPSLKRIPVVVLTSSREEQDLVKSYQLGVNAYVVKPVGFPEFVSAISQVGVFWTMHNEPPPPGRPDPG